MAKVVSMTSFLSTEDRIDAGLELFEGYTYNRYGCVTI